MERSLPAAFFLVTAFLLAKGVEASLGFSVFAGLLCDAPAVYDERSFDSRCSVEPLVGGRIGWSGLGRARLETEALYSRRSFESPAFVTDTAVRADFLELALLGAWPIHEGSGALRVTAVVGPQVGLRLRARRRFQDVDQDITEELRPADLKIVSGLRLSHRAGRGDVFVEGRLAWGLTDLDDTNEQQIHSRALSIQLGYAR